jgi:hypothetical protein
MPEMNFALMPFLRSKTLQRAKRPTGRSTTAVSVCSSLSVLRAINIMRQGTPNNDKDARSYILNNFRIFHCLVRRKVVLCKCIQVCKFIHKIVILKGNFIILRRICSEQ